MQQAYQSNASALRGVCYRIPLLLWWTRISCTSDSLSDNSLKHGAAGAGSDWVGGRT